MPTPPPLALTLCRPAAPPLWKCGAREKVGGREGQGRKNTSDSYITQAVTLPPGVIAAIHSRRRAFLWSGTDRTSGAKCLVSWEVAQKPKKEGGMGVCDLAAQNACLLLKLLHRLHHPADSAWAAWARQHTDLLVTMEGNGDGNHWEGLKALLPASYRCITKVQLGDGAATAFWWDSWLGEYTLADRFPCLLRPQPLRSARRLCSRRSHPGHLHYAGTTSVPLVRLRNGRGRGLDRLCLPTPLTGRPIQ